MINNESNLSYGQHILAVHNIKLVVLGEGKWIVYFFLDENGEKVTYEGIAKKKIQEKQ